MKNHTHNTHFLVAVPIEAMPHVLELIAQSAEHKPAHTGRSAHSRGDGHKHGGHKTHATLRHTKTSRSTGH